VTTPPDRIIAPDGNGILLLIKAIPGARRDQIAGPLGDRLKVRVAAPAEGGKANRAICGLLATATGLRTRDVHVVAGHASADKRIRIDRIDPARARERLGLPPT